jgi:FixJ family two-component response regulator
MKSKESLMERMHYGDVTNQLVLLVDDDHDFVNTCADLLKRIGVRYLTFFDPLEALNYISKNNISRVYTDYHMSGYGISGKWIKELCKEKNIPCFIVSGDFEEADISKIDFVMFHINNHRNVVK